MGYTAIKPPRKKYTKSVACRWAAYRDAERAVAFLTLRDNKAISLLQFVTDAMNAKSAPILKEARIAPSKESDRDDLA